MLRTTSVWGLGCRVLGLSVQDLRVNGLGFRVSCRFKALLLGLSSVLLWNSLLKIWGAGWLRLAGFRPSWCKLGCRIWASGLSVSGLGMNASGFSLGSKL